MSSKESPNLVIVRDKDKAPVIPGAKAFLASIVESSEDAIISKTLEGNITSWNLGAERIFGYKAEEIIGKPITILIPVERIGEESDIIYRLKSGQRIDHFETVRKRKDGSLISISLTVSPIRDEEGTIIGASKIARDISSRKKIEEERDELLRSERAARSEAERVSLIKDEFLATLSHELRTPLNAIMGWAQILIRQFRENKDLVNGLSIIERNSRLQGQLIGDLLDMSRIISGKIRLDVRPLDLEEIVRAAMATVQPSADARGIMLQMASKLEAVSVRGDASRLQQCVWNLLSNAIKFTPRDGRIRVVLESTEDSVAISVTDSGEGIAPEFLPHVFDRFRQADASAARKHGGLGLGLAIVRNLIELHGGHVSAHSEGEGRGSTFRLELPLSAARDSASREHAGRKPEVPANDAQFELPDLSGISVLVIEDEADGRDLVKRILEDCGATVIPAESAREGLELLQSRRPDIIISDIGMPGEDGYQFIRKVRGLAPENGGRTPAAALTAFTRPEDRTRALNAGYHQHIGKPFDAGELAAVTASLATRRN